MTKKKEEKLTAKEKENFRKVFLEWAIKECGILLPVNP